MTVRCSGRYEKVNGCTLPSVSRSKLDGALREYFLTQVFDPDLSRAAYEAERERATTRRARHGEPPGDAATAARARCERIKRD